VSSRLTSRHGEETVWAWVAGNPLFVGALTVLVALIALFLSYNANKGLPFVPTYTVTAEVRDANGLIPANEVTIGGRRVGVVDDVDAALDEEGRPFAKVRLKLDGELEGRVRQDAIVRIRPASLFELKYVSLLPGEGKPLPEGGTIPIEQSRVNINLADAFSVFDEPTRRNIQALLAGAGEGLAARGADVNVALSLLPALLREVRPVLADLADPATRLGETVHALAAVSSELASVAPELASLLEGATVTLAALEEAGPELEATLERLPATIETGTSSLAELRPSLRMGRRLAATLRRASPLLAPTSERLASALEAGIPALASVPALSVDLDATLRALRAATGGAPLAASLRKLQRALPRLELLVRFAGPYQTICNYGGLAARNVPSSFAEGTASGNWLRFIPVFSVEEGTQSAEPAPELHYNPYAHGAGQGQPRECEAGNEVYLHGRRIGNIPGNQGTATEATGGRR
jgi:virulence factor Mce-like protein